MLTPPCFLDYSQMKNPSKKLAVAAALLTRQAPLCHCSTVLKPPLHSYFSITVSARLCRTRFCSVTGAASAVVYVLSLQSSSPAPSQLQQSCSSFFYHLFFPAESMREGTPSSQDEK